jgi:hypothetical protein
MEKSLKEKNRPQLIVFAMVNAIGLAILLQGLKQVLVLVDCATKGNLGILSRLVAAPAVLALVIGVLSWSMPKRWKETMIFWRIHDCLPSGRAFTVIAHRDSRIDRRRLVEKYGDLPARSAKQTALWYRLYKKNERDPAVEDAHGAYLRYREMIALIGSVMLFFLVASAWVRPSTRTIVFGVLIIAGEYFPLLLAARNAADHFVANVLAIESAADYGIPSDPL